MTEEVKTRLFEPLFTTKEKGKGTGLGPATCYKIVQQAGGYIRVYSQSGIDTTIRVYLPLVEATPAPAEEERPDTVSGGTEMILLAEDEPLVGQLSLNILRQHGYTVLEAENGVEALRVAEHNMKKK